MLGAVSGITIAGSWSAGRSATSCSISTHASWCAPAHRSHSRRRRFQLLGLLVERHPRALSKTELQDRLWPDTFVVEKNLTNLVSEIREALGDDPATPRFIRTVHRFGYAFRETPSMDSGDHDIGTRHNLPAPLTNFIGRDREVAELLQLVPAARVLTLTGAGGCGKTRLALEVAARALDRFPDGAWVVDLSALADPRLVTQAVASVFDIREGPNRPILDALHGYLRNRQILLVLDNCEHLITACAHFVDALLRAADRVCILATSREGLGITGETVWRVPSLSLPDLSEAASVETLLRHDAVRLFIERASAVDSTFAFTAANAAAVAEVCVRLDGIPLALELAAARVKVLSIAQIHARLNDRFRLLTGGSRTAVARQRTLEATVEWSYGLLSGAERRLMRRLSVFAGGWTMEAAEDVTSDNAAERDDVLESLSRLVDKSLANVESDSEGNRRYHFLETVRQYARERLFESGEAERLRDRHLAFFHDLVRRAEPELTRADQIAWLNRLQREHDNLRLALEWCLAAPERGVQSMELAGALCWFWLKRGDCPRRAGVVGARAVERPRRDAGAPGQDAHVSRVHDVLPGRLRPHAGAGGRKRRSRPHRGRPHRRRVLARRRRARGAGARRRRRVRASCCRGPDGGACEHHSVDTGDGCRLPRVSGDARG